LRPAGTSNSQPAPEHLGPHRARRDAPQRSACFPAPPTNSSRWHRGVQHRLHDPLAPISTTTWARRGEWGHPSDNLGANPRRDRLPESANGQSPFHHSVMCSPRMIQAHEIQGVLALTNSFQFASDSITVILVKSRFDLPVATRTARRATREQIIDMRSRRHGLDGQAMRTYRHFPQQPASRKSWAAGDATSRGGTIGDDDTQWRDGIAVGAHRAAMGNSRIVLFRGRPLDARNGPFGSYVMEKRCCSRSPIPPNSTHRPPSKRPGGAASADCESTGRQSVRSPSGRTKSAVSHHLQKLASSNNPRPTRDHCLQYMIAIALLHGDPPSAETL